MTSANLRTGGQARIAGTEAKYREQPTRAAGPARAADKFTRDKRGTATAGDRSADPVPNTGKFPPSAPRARTTRARHAPPEGSGRSGGARRQTRHARQGKPRSRNTHTRACGGAPSTLACTMHGARPDNLKKRRGEEMCTRR